MKLSTTPLRKRKWQFSNAQRSLLASRNDIYHRYHSLQAMIPVRDVISGITDVRHSSFMYRRILSSQYCASCPNHSRRLQFPQIRFLGKVRIFVARRRCHFRRKRSKGQHRSTAPFPSQLNSTSLNEASLNDWFPTTTGNKMHCQAPSSTTISVTSVVWHQSSTVRYRLLIFTAR